MLGLTATQLALLQDPAQQIKAAVAIGTAAPLRYCTGANPIQIGADWYTPRAIEFDEIKLDDPIAATTTIVIDDLDGVLRTKWYSERFSGLTVDIYVYALADGATWTEVVDLSWICTTVQFNRKGQMKLGLLGGAGLRPRAGLMTGNRNQFMFAPEPGEAMRFGTSGITFNPGSPDPPPPPTGQQNPWELRGSVVTDGESSRILANLPTGGVAVIDRPRSGGTQANTTVSE